MIGRRARLAFTVYVDGFMHVPVHEYVQVTTSVLP